VGSIVFGGSGLIAMQQPGSKPEAKNELRCSQEVQKEIKIIQALRNSLEGRRQKPEGGVSHHMDFGQSWGKQLLGGGIDDRRYFESGDEFPGYKSNPRLGC
jgi:hypothetical protein